MDAEELIQRRKDKAIAIILRMKENDCDPHLPPAVRIKLRKIVLDQLNDFTDLVLDVVSSLENSEVVVTNELWLQKLNEVHEVVVTNGARRIPAGS